MFKKTCRAAFLSLMTVGLLFWQVQVPCYASEIVPNPDEAVNEHIREFLSEINEEGKQFLHRFFGRKFIRSEKRVKNSLFIRKKCRKLYLGLCT